jgi:5-methylcytosine-specific restriction enzyme subunit McrC
VFLRELEQILQRGLLKGYQTFEENNNLVKGKILFKENIFINYNRPDRIYCSFDELSTDILENRIIKFVLQSLSQCYYFDDNINAKMLQLSKFLDDITLQPFTKEAINLIEYTPLNHHYKTILSLCELFLQSFSIEQRIGEKTVNAFLIDMNLLFEKFVVNILKTTFVNLQIQEQKKEYADLTKQLESKLDIVISFKKKPILILDTKYKEYKDRPDADDRDQLIAYSTISEIKNCGLIYPGKNLIPNFAIKTNIVMHIVMIDLQAENSKEFEEKVKHFTNFFYLYLVKPLLGEYL